MYFLFNADILNLLINTNGGIERGEGEEGGETEDLILLFL